MREQDQALFRHVNHMRVQQREGSCALVVQLLIFIRDV